jgi:AsmA protein
VTAATGFKRLAIAVAAFILAGVAVLGAIALLIPVDKVREAATAEIRNVTGLDLVLRGDVSVSLFPTGAISFDKVALGDSTEPALDAERLTARLRFFPMLIGRVEIADVVLVRPRINVTFGPNGRTNWAALIETLARALGPKPEHPVGATLTEIRVDDGTIAIKDSTRGVAETFRNVELALAWPSISKSFAATGRFVWHDEPIDAAITLTDFAAALAGNRSGLKLRLSGAPMKLAFEGTWSTRPTLKIEGTVAADTASLRHTLRWAGLKPLSGGGFGRFALKAKTSVSGGTFAFSTVNVELDGNAAEGVLTFASDGRQTLQGTLAANELDLTPYVSAIRLLTSNERDWNQLPIMLDGLSGFDLDLRLSAAKMTIAHAKLGRTAVGINLRGGKLAVTIGESQAFGGILKGSLALAGSADHGADFKSQFQFTDVNLENCLDELFGMRRVEGRGNLALDIESGGPTILALTRALNGTADLAGRQGALVGVNIEQLLRRLERRPLSGTGDFRTGRTPFEKMTVKVKIADGIANVDDVRIEGTKVRLGLAGTASIPEREFDLRGVAALTNLNANEAQPAFELPFVVQGSWDDPIMLPDTEALLQRSPLASPLLDAVKNRNTRDTVRSAIERLTGGRREPAAAPAAAAEPAR